ncbi:Uncharacterized protein SCF082_LOCUS12554 [Durusdinium trenchii]|uniref:Uncharacterized protein n=1 Tax=Durusdinium trenchii TaxID=1381693 RepID=A0ABP0JKN2_9DINO
MEDGEDGDVEDVEHEEDEAVQELLIQYLSSGQGYDDESVSLALQEGNQLFQQKDFSRACDFFGIAYEIGWAPQLAVERVGTTTAIDLCCTTCSCGELSATPCWETLKLPSRRLRKPSGSFHTRLLDFWWLLWSIPS